MSTYRSSLGFPPFIATHTREAKCGHHKHTVCFGTYCSSHYDNWNPDCGPEEFVKHCRDDFFPKVVVPAIAAVTVGAIVVGLFSLLLD